MSDKCNPLVVLTTVAREDEAKEIAKGVVAAKLVACVNIIGPMTSVYEWQGKVVEDTEFKLVMKTTDQMKTHLFEFIKNHHSYSVPEITALPVNEMYEPYFAWVQQTAKGNV